jgi:hypothetical protein
LVVIQKKEEKSTRTFVQPNKERLTADPISISTSISISISISMSMSIHTQEYSHMTSHSKKSFTEKFKLRLKLNSLPKAKLSNH